MNLAADIGAIALGMFVGYLVWFFVSKFSAFNVSGLTSILGAVLAGAALKYLTQAQNAQILMYYPIGLVMGATFFGCYSWFRPLMAQEVRNELDQPKCPHCGKALS